VQYRAIDTSSSVSRNGVQLGGDRSLTSSSSACGPGSELDASSLGPSLVVVVFCSVTCMLSSSPLAPSRSAAAAAAAHGEDDDDDEAVSCSCSRSTCSSRHRSARLSSCRHMAGTLHVVKSGFEMHSSLRPSYSTLKASRCSNEWRE